MWGGRRLRCQNSGNVPRLSLVFGIQTITAISRDESGVSPRASVGTLLTSHPGFFTLLGLGLQRLDNDVSRHRRARLAFPGWESTRHAGRRSADVARSRLSLGGTFWRELWTRVEGARSGDGRGQINSYHYRYRVIVRCQEPFSRWSHLTGSHRARDQHPGMKTNDMSAESLSSLLWIC